jgi:hypothetical protein
MAAPRSFGIEYKTFRANPIRHGFAKILGSQNPWFRIRAEQHPAVALLGRSAPLRALSSEVDTGSREENASKQ